MKILVLSPAKCDSTYLHSLIFKSRPDPKVSIFEDIDRALRFGYEGEVVSKILLDHIMRKDNPDVIVDKLIRKFDKVILLCRDPRDAIISRFIFCFGPMFIDFANKDKEKYFDVIRLLEKKESGDNISFKKILKATTSGRVRLYDNYMGQFVSVFSWLIRLKETKNVFVMKYEDIIDKNMRDLNDYLGFEVSGFDNKMINPTKALIARTKKFDNWKSFFTSTDVEWLKLQYWHLLYYLDYSLDWDLSDEPISSEHYSEYMKKNIEATGKNASKPRRRRRRRR
jgi:hypothetical protein